MNPIAYGGPIAYIGPAEPGSFSSDYLPTLFDGPGGGALAVTPPVAFRNPDLTGYGLGRPGASMPNSQTNSAPNAPMGISGAGLLGLAIVAWYLLK